MSAARVISYDFRGNFTSLIAGLATAGKGVQDLGVKLTALDKNGAKMRAGLDTLGGAAGKLGLVAAAGLGAAVVASANFDQAMSKVQAATGESAAAMEELRAAALKAGADTAFSASEAAAGVENLAKAGVSTADILGGGLSGALDLAAAGELDVASAAEIAATAMTQFKLSGEDVPHVADLLAAGAGKAQGEVTDLAAALNQSGLVAGQMGLSIEETTGALAAFASAGLLGSDAGTSLKTMLLRLANPSKEAADTMAELGINAYDASGNLVSMSDLAGQIEGAFEGMTQKQRDAALATIFGSDAIRAANVLYSEGADGIRTWTDNVDDAGYAAETAATKMDNLKGDLEAFMGSLETALIGTGDGAQGPLRSLVQGATDAVNAFNDLPAPVKNATGALLGLTAVFGGGLWFTSKVVGGIATTKTALEQLGLSGDKASAALRGVAKAGLGLAALNVASVAFDALQDKASGSVPEIEKVTEALLNLQDAEFASQFDGIGEAIDRINSGGFDGFLDNVNEFGERIPVLGDHVTTFLGFSAGIGPQLSEAGTEVERLGKQFEGLDAALAGLVSSGSAERAQAAFDQLAASQGLSASEQEQLLGLLPQYEAALTGVANQVTLASGETVKMGGAAELLLGPLGEAAGATDDLAGASRGSADAAKDEAAAIRDSIKAMQAKRDAALAAFDAETSWRQALKDAAAQAKKTNAGIKGNTDAALENRTALSNLAGAWNGLSNQAQNMPGRFQTARKSFVDTAVAMGVPRKAAVELARELLEIPTKVVTKTSVETGNSHAEIQGVFDHLTRLNGKTATTYVHVVRTGGEGDYVSGGKPRATGGYISGPGTATSDSIPARLSNGEYVIKASAVAQYGVGFMDAINAQRFASGGLASTAKMTQVSGDTYGYNVVSAAAFNAANGLGALAGMSDRALKAQAKELEQRQRLLEKELERDKARLDMLRQEREAIASAVSGAFHVDPFSNNGGAWTEDELRERGLSEDQIAAHMANQQANALTAGIADKQEALRLLKILRQRGLNGPAFVNLAATGDVATLRAYVEMSKADLRAYEQMTNQNLALEQKLGNFAGNAEMGKDIRAQLREVRESRQELREANHQLRKVTRLLEKAPKETGEATADALDHASGNGRRRR